MSWEKRDCGGLYYTRNKWVDGKATKEYIGSGLKGHLADLEDTRERLQRQRDRHHWDYVIAGIDRNGESTQRLSQLATQITRAIMLLAGYYRHQRGEWRRRANV